MQSTHMVGTVATLVYMLIIPESPRWLFLNNRHDEGINNLNYIAWFNGSLKRIPLNAQFDFLEQAVIQ